MDSTFNIFLSLAIAKNVFKWVFYWQNASSNLVKCLLVWKLDVFNFFRESKRKKWRLFHYSKLHLRLMKLFFQWYRSSTHLKLLYLDLFNDYPLEFNIFNRLFYQRLFYQLFIISQNYGTWIIEDEIIVTRISEDYRLFICFPDVQTGSIKSYLLWVSVEVWGSSSRWGNRSAIL